MEIALALGVAIAGYQLSLSREHERTLATPPPDTTTTMYALESARHRKKVKKKSKKKPRYDAVPDEGRKFSGNAFVGAESQPDEIQPFYRQRPQAHSDSYADRRVETMTGLDSNGVFLSKREVPAMFDPMPQPIDSSGGQGNTYDWERRMPIPSLYQNNTAPEQPRQVGPGLNLPADVVSQAQMQWRPSNEQIERSYMTPVNQLPARGPEHGFNPVSARMDDSFFVQTSTNEKFMTYEKRPPIATPQTDTVGPAIRQEFTKPVCGRWPTQGGAGEEDVSFTPATNPGGGNAGYASIGQSTHGRSDTSAATPAMNFALGVNAPGGYTNYGGATNDKLPTQRGDAETFAASHPSMPIEGLTRPKQGRTTLRELTEGEAASRQLNVSGVTAAVTGPQGPLTMRCATQLLREAKRGVHLTASRIQPGRQNAYNTEVNVSAKDNGDRCVTKRLPGGPGTSAALSGTPGGIGEVSVTEKLPVENTRPHGVLPLCTSAN